ncbi:TPA: hypothetical protein N2D99_002328 [Clostridium botulinum]|nr:hypothetical protein [Clostridium botulinum]
MKINNKFIKTTIFSLMLIFALMMFTQNTYAIDVQKGFINAMNSFISEYKIHIMGFLGFGIMTGVLAFIVQFMKLGAYSSNPNMRAHIIKEMIIVGITTALLGALPLLVMLFYLNFK